MANPIIEGGDERIEILSNGLNKYHVNPSNYKGIYNRGSCTCNPLNAESEKFVQRLELRLKNGETYNQILDDQRQRIKSLLNFEGEDKFDVFFTPSGSDLVYLPILICSVLYPEKKIVNLLTCPEELGSGSQIAAEGRFFMEKNQFGERVKKGKLISSGIDIDVLHFNARTSTGHIIDHKANLIREIQHYKNEAIIGSLVIGSKSGIMDNLSIIDEVDKDIIWSIDLCQFRNRKKLINDLLDKNCMVMLTGSKFYQAPPFCGATLISKNMIERIQSATDLTNAKLFKAVFTKENFPTSLTNLSKEFKSYNNIGLLYRWECAISEMEKFDQIDRETIDEIIDTWNQIVKSSLESYSCFELMPNQAISNRTIISFRVKKDGKFLNHSELKRLHQIISTSPLSWENYNKLNIGQPVAYQDKSFIRLALGHMTLGCF